MPWILAGFALSAALAAFASIRARSRGGYFDDQVYGIGTRTHRAYAIGGAAFAAAFAVCGVLHLADAAPYLLAALVLVAVFYGTSFLRGFSDED